MKELKRPRTVLIDTNSHSEQKKSGLLGRMRITDYNSPEGVIREYLSGGKLPQYRLLKTKEPVCVVFTHSMIEDMDDMRYFVGE